MSNKERINKIKANEKKIMELTKQRNETIKKLFRIYEEKKKGNDKK